MKLFCFQTLLLGLIILAQCNDSVCSKTEKLKLSQNRSSNSSKPEPSVDTTSNIGTTSSPTVSARTTTTTQPVDGTGNSMDKDKDPVSVSTQSQNVSEMAHSVVAQLRKKKIQEKEQDSELDVPDDHCCPNGWYVNAGSCYWLEDEPREFFDAQNFCQNKSSTLMVLSGPHEQHRILYQARVLQWVWVGLSTKFFKSETDEELAWVTTGGQHFHELPWLLPLATRYGQLGDISCVAFYERMSITLQSHFHFHNCRLKFSFICERNVTTTLMRDAVQQLRESNPKFANGTLKSAIDEIMHEEISLPTPPPQIVFAQHHGYWSRGKRSEGFWLWPTVPRGRTSYNGR